MPHISPMLWTQSLIMFWALLVLFILLFWWHLPPQFPYFKPISNSASPRNWKWS
uniref:ATP synthase F0 subunit 8 n=3 Tax=Sternaspis TaxID=36132 RepID=A0A6C0UES7_9ANNE|nr:ATP synthase F0 subunit 8 [Sternaspis chinensis]YP_010580933.1 ATP synthase F0 subunit 8 [Sternaspis liui]QIB72575.1 ATP synthase F0 subunit 8 [Sternaspis scutata]UZT27131.1 ATP synthase F0 subunit 8 [Sternaspis chinensis]UZT27144.1 ATP synthase F0 subunit 8 [Sternaspis liui]